MLKKVCIQAMQKVRIARLNIMKKCKINYNSMVSLRSELEGYNVIHNKAVIANSHIGFGTYIGPNSAFYNSTIGRYCSIGSNVTVILGKHPSNTFVSTHPSFFSLQKQSGFTYVNKQKFDELYYINNEKQISLEIGNDVWIGEGVKIIGGIIIGNGVIVGAGSVVTKNLEPYYIYAGVPARKIGQRFTNQQIEILEKIRWWERDQHWIANHAEKFSNIEDFILCIKNEENI